jgi:hypothetical protein
MIAEKKRFFVGKKNLFYAFVGVNVGRKKDRCDTINTKKRKIFEKKKDFFPQTMHYYLQHFLSFFYDIKKYKLTQISSIFIAQQYH